MGEFDDIRISFIFEGDYESYPIGGTLFFLRCMLKYWSLGEVNLYGSAPHKKEKTKYIKVKDKYFLRYGLYIHKGRKSSLIPERFRSVFHVQANKTKILKNSDILYFHAPETMLPFFKTNKIKIHHLHGYHNPLEFSRFKYFRWGPFVKFYDKFIYLPSLNLADVVIPSNRESLLKYKKLSENYTIIDFYIPVCVDTSKFYPIENSNESFNLLYVGRLSEIKGVDLLIKAMKYLINYNNNIRLYIAGSGEEERNLVKMSKSLGVYEKISFLGFVNRDKLPAIYQMADVFVLPTLGEGFSMVKLEAMASGLPIVISDTSTAEGVIDGYNGYIFKKRDPKVLANLILKALENKKYLGMNSRQIAEKYFSAPIVTKRIENIFKYAITKDEHYLELAKKGFEKIEPL